MRGIRGVRTIRSTLHEPTTQRRGVMRIVLRDGMSRAQAVVVGRSTGVSAYHCPAPNKRPGAWSTHPGSLNGGQQRRDVKEGKSPLERLQESHQCLGFVRRQTERL